MFLLFQLCYFQHTMKRLDVFLPQHMLLLQDFIKWLAYFDQASQVALVGRKPPASAGDSGSIRRLGIGNDNSLQYSCLENLMDRGSWLATVHEVAKSQTGLKQLSTHTTLNWLRYSCTLYSRTNDSICFPKIKFGNMYWEPFHSIWRCFPKANNLKYRNP